ncbi:MAG TPA: roadblock/LC7 domain-containing protein [Anaeromyxobacteraceae bacterium]|nr:roadblock/LC7 domain-containing protein [Anaeromyxobacteraceae bacterium]HQR31029.1 roadblock/LC7 domain-containing protein [Anaeromyxobacteraceae bacterium]
MNPGLVLYEEEFRKISGICDRLTRDASAKVVFLVDKNGQLIAASGQAQGLDTTSLASLTAGNVAAMGGLAKLIGEREFPSQFHEGERDSLHMSVVGGRVVLVVIFDARSSLGLVRLRVKKATDELARVFDELSRRQPAAGAQSPFAEITDDDIDNLFNA